MEQVEPPAGAKMASAPIDLKSRKVLPVKACSFTLKPVPETMPLQLPQGVNDVVVVDGAVHLNQTVCWPAAAGSPSWVVAPSVFCQARPEAPLRALALPRLSLAGGVGVV